jgi:hypothetical protein
MYLNIYKFTQHGQIFNGYIELVSYVAIASEGRQTPAMLRRESDSAQPTLFSHRIGHKRRCL